MQRNKNPGNMTQIIWNSYLMNEVMEIKPSAMCKHLEIQILEHCYLETPKEQHAKCVSVLSKVGRSHDLSWRLTEVCKCQSLENLIYWIIKESVESSMRHLFYLLLKSKLTQRSTLCLFQTTQLVVELEISPKMENINFYYKCNEVNMHQLKK